MHTLSPAARKRLQLETLLHAVDYYYHRLAEELRRDAERPEHMRAVTELKDLWRHRMDVCKAEELRLKEQIAEVQIEEAYERTPVPGPIVNEPVAKAGPKRRKAKTVEGWT